MAEIALRAYVKEIDDLVEREQLDEAIAHSRHILETYPKHLDTYRLLGKAYLEAKRYGDAADLFQRVLSAIPDDFVAHIGMSIVREDEGNLDASIWHMERAFETNPANPAIQQELRRLIGKRDGLEPHKVRLTRGALARMYAHGELYPQAIAELRSALQEDPDRPDLQVLLVSLHWRTDQKEQAAEVARQVLEKLPFCREANRIVAGALQASGKAEEGAPYHRRLAALDPYAAFVETALTDPATVDAGSVHLQKLEWRPGQPVSAPGPPRPSWSDSLGAGLRAEPKAPPAAGPLPSWLADEAQQRPAAPPPAPPPEVPSMEPEPASVVHPFAGAKAPPADIPPWMREAGWSESTGEAVEGPVAFSDEELAGAPPAPVGEGELAPADIPDWLQDIAPTPADGGAERAGGPPDWLAGIAAEQEPELTAPQPPAAPPPSHPAKTGDRSEVPTWLEEPSPGATETIVTWLGDRSARSAVPQAETPKPPAEEPLPEAEQPSWLTEPVSFEAEAPETPEPAAEGVPSWLSGVAEAAASDRPSMAEPPSWVTEETSEESIEHELVERPLSPSEAPDWLRAIAQPVEEAPAPEAGEPDWLAGLSSAAAMAPKPADAAGPEWLRGIGEADEAPAAPMDERDAPEWLRGLGGAPTPTPAADARQSEPDWLAGLTSTTPAAASAGLGSAAGIDWLQGIGEPELGPAEPVGAGTPPADVAPGNALDDDWLRGLAGEATETPGAPAEEAEPWLGAGEAAEPADLPGETPDWLGRLAAAQDETPPTVSAQPSWLEDEAAEPDEEADEGPGWLAEMPGIAAPARPAIPEPVADDWLKGLIDDTGLTEEPGPTAGAEEPDWFAAEPAGEAIPDAGPDIRATATGWLREAADQAPPPDADASTPTPDWLREFEAAGGPPAAPGAPTVIARRGADKNVPAAPGTPIESMDASTAGELGEDDVQKWLEALASRQEAGTARGEIEAGAKLPAAGADFPPPVAPRQPPPEQPEEGIEWLEQMAAQSRTGDAPRPTPPPWQPIDTEPVAEAAPPPAEAEDEEVPDWLRSLAAEGEVSEPMAEPAAEAEAEPDDMEWLQSPATTTISARTPGEPPSRAVAEPVAPPSDEEAPAWLKIPAATEPPVEPEPAPAAAAAPDETPDWLRSPAPTESAYDFEAQRGEESDETPYWLRKAAASEAQTARLYTEDETGGVPDWLKQAAEAEAGPSSAEATGAAVAESRAPSEPAPALEKPAAPEPSWLRPSGPSEEKPVVPEAEIVVPEWLRAPVDAPRSEAVPAVPPVEEPTPPAVAPVPVPPAPAAVAPPPVAVPPAPVEAVPAPTVAPPAPAPVPVAPPPVPVPAAATPPPAPPVQLPAEPVGVPAPVVASPGEPPAAEGAVAPGVPAEAPVPAKVPKPRTTARTPGETLSAARQALAANDIKAAAKHYGALVRRRSMVEDVIVDLKVAVERLPDTAELWQALGDAYMKADMPAEAVEAYRHGLANL